MKCIITADIHAGVHKDDEIWLRQTESLFNQIHDTAIKENIKDIVVLGDLFHDRKVVNIATLNRTYNMLKSLNMFNIILLLGNHDTYHKHHKHPNAPVIFVVCVIIS